jgi:hypothetical protein
MIVASSGDEGMLCQSCEGRHGVCCLANCLDIVFNAMIDV